MSTIHPAVVSLLKFCRYKVCCIWRQSRTRGKARLFCVSKILARLRNSFRHFNRNKNVQLSNCQNRIFIGWNLFDSAWQLKEDLVESGWSRVYVDGPMKPPSMNRHSRSSSIYADVGIRNGFPRRCVPRSISETTGCLLRAIHSIDWNQIGIGKLDGWSKSYELVGYSLA